MNTNDETRSAAKSGILSAQMEADARFKRRMEQEEERHRLGMEVMRKQIAEFDSEKVARERAEDRQDDREAVHSARYADQVKWWHEAMAETRKQTLLQAAMLLVLTVIAVVLIAGK